MALKHFIRPVKQWIPAFCNEFLTHLFFRVYKTAYYEIGRLTYRLTMAIAKVLYAEAAESG
jgi:hypothetical protein